MIDWFIMAKRKLDDEGMSGGLWVTSQGTQTESDSRPEKKQKTKDMRLPRFVVTMISYEKDVDAKGPKLEFWKEERKDFPGKFSILIRGEENAYNIAIDWMLDELEEQLDDLKDIKTWDWVIKGKNGTLMQKIALFDGINLRGNVRGRHISCQVIRAC